MNTEQFLDLVLPTKGYRCIAKVQEFGYAHHVLSTNQDAAKRAIWLDYTNNEEVYFACGSLREKFILGKNARGQEKKMYRVRENIAHLKSFWVDLDVGDDPAKYPTQKDAILSLVKFLKETGLPAPLIVNSGYGIHAYFVLTQDIEVAQWDKVANLLHELMVGTDLKFDPKRSRDASSVLRPIGTRNKKDSVVMPVVRQIGVKVEPVGFIDFTKRVVAAIKAKGIVPKSNYVRSNAATVSANDALTAGIYDQASYSAQQIAEACPAIKHMRDSQGNITEPFWYDAIGVLRHTKESPEIIHSWSCGHPGYSESQTEAKIEQHIGTGSGPTTCAHFHGFTDARIFCESCPNFNVITSPIQLGREVNKAVEKPADLGTKEAKAEFVPRDIGMFELTSEGVLYKDSFEPGHKVEPETKVVVLNYPLIIKATAEDDRKGGVIQVECRHPNKGLHSFFMEKSVLAEKSAFNKELLKNHIALSAGKVDLMRDYTIAYLQDLDRSEKLQMLYSTMGWKEDGQFVLGAKCLEKGKPIQDAGLSVHLEGSFCRHLDAAGDLDKWVEATTMLDKPGMERHALSLLWGFGAPLMQFTGFSGTFISIVGRSNAGKTSLQAFLTSIYGKFNELKAQKGDTYVSLMSRLGSLNNLPFVMDEMTNFDPNDVSDFIHSISQGREKARMTQQVTDRKPRTWSTLAIGSSNSSMTDKLMAVKGDPEAERLRMIEYWLHETASFEQDAKELHKILDKNYGVAGQHYLQYIVDNVDVVKKIQLQVQTTLEGRIQARGKERFWIAAMTCALTGGFIAEKLGLVKFDMDRVHREAESIITNMRGDLTETSVKFSSVLGRYLNTHAQNVLFAKYNKDGLSALYEPNRELYIRVEHIEGGKRVFVDKTHILKWLQSISVSSSEFVRDNMSSGVLLDLNASKVLGAGWDQNPNNAKVPVMAFFLQDESEEERSVNVHLLTGNKQII